MLDINNALRNFNHLDSDPEGNLYALEHWTPNVANKLATQEGLQLSDEHWEVIFYLRERYRVQGNKDSARVILHELEQEFSAGMGRGHLYKLFPQGPVSQGSRMAGLPLPPHSNEPSFGSIM